MLRPTKHSHPDRTVINVTLIIQARMRERRLDEYDALLKYTRKAVAGGDVLFLPSLNFLSVVVNATRAIFEERVVRKGFFRALPHLREL